MLEQIFVWSEKLMSIIGPILDKKEKEAQEY